MSRRYNHTQTGFLLIIALSIGMLFFASDLYMNGYNLIMVAGLVMLTFALVIFSSLTVTIEQDQLIVRFGPGPIQKRFSLDTIQSCQVVKNRWYYGWGVRRIPRGWLINVSGFDAVELKLKTGEQFRIGTDEPQELARAIRDSIESNPGQ